MATVRPWGRRLPARAITTGLCTMLALTLAGSAFVLLDLVSLVTYGAPEGRDGQPEWGGFAERLCFAAVALLLLLTISAWRQRTRNTCARCGGPAHPPDIPLTVEHPAPSASPRVRLIAHLGCLIFLPYYTCHLMRFADLPPFRGSRVADPGDPFIPAFIICTALPAEFLLLGLVHSWGMVFPRWTLWLRGRRVPRFLPTAPVWLIAPTLGGYGIGAWVYLVLRLTGVVASPASGYGLAGRYGNQSVVADYLLGGTAATAFAGYGFALAIAAVSYLRRTRPRCVPLTENSHATESVARAYLSGN